MEGSNKKSQGTQPPPDRGHPQPRRTSPENSVTLYHHRLARDTTRRASAGPVDAPAIVASPSRRNSSGESQSHESAAPSDPKKWFDRSNRNPMATFDASSMDVDPPFFQKETDSSNEGLRESGGSRPEAGFQFGSGARRGTHLRPTVTHSSSADDYRSVIDDLTIENKRLKEELKRYKQFGPDMMQKEKLFEIKVHGLPKRKKRELEATLRDFAASLEGSSEAPSRRKSGRKGLYSSGESMSKRASSSSSRSRPVDSAYASMSAGANSNAPKSSKASLSLGRPSAPRAKTVATNKVEDYLRDTPDGLFPRHLVITDKERKKLVVRRLEHLFTGKLAGRGEHRTSSVPNTEIRSTDSTTIMAPPRAAEAVREARIQSLDIVRKKPRSRDNLSSNSNGDQTESGGNGIGSGDGGSGGRTGHNSSPPGMPLPEQRPTRPKDLDPDRVQVPSENMEYIRHLGLVPPEFLVGHKATHSNVSPDAEGWVYLNLLCNLAQLHMINVTPSFIRSAVSEKSAKFQLSPDGRKIRWRGGTDGTKFSSDSGGENSQKSPSTDDTEASNGGSQRKRLKTHVTSGGSSSKFGPQISNSGDSFHYKPMFVQQSSSVETSLEGTASPGSEGAVEESNLGNTAVHSKWDYSGSGSSQRKKRRRDGAIVYYSGAPFCIDLSGDPGDHSPTTYMTSTGQELDSVRSPVRLLVHRTLSGSSLAIRPLSDARADVSEAMDMDLDNPPDLWRDDENTPNEEELEFPWCDKPEEVQVHPFEPLLEACGLGGVIPEDHFAVIVTTRRPVLKADRSKSEDPSEAVLGRLASMSTSSPPPRPRALSRSFTGVELKYLSGQLKRMKPAPLPPPARFFPPFSTDDDSDGSQDEMDSELGDLFEEDSVSKSLISQRANPHLSDNTYPEADDLQSDESDDEIIGAKNEVVMSETKSVKGRGKVREVQVAVSAGTGQRPELLHTGSSVATAGGAESGYNSSMEDDA
ncbi:frequency clock protein [Lasiosphaeris hirsuta]|uniref:Frequency clock protein n=1 Tax=Lasiosphaeris hirsuta TaxID=260670 RepID=A0AA40B0T7_9PEZI|nr:frequency clock protein [Lasiosphaeris hirsuta]